MVTVDMVRLSSQAEVQQVYGDGTLSLHTRSLKYGKVSLLCVSYCTPASSLYPRSRPSTSFLVKPYCKLWEVG